MHACPHCGEQSITRWRKSSTGPLRSFRCRKCAAEISVDWPRSLFAILFAGSIPLFSFLVFLEFGLLAGIGAFVLGFVLYNLYQTHVVRLVVRRPPEN